MIALTRKVASTFLQAHVSGGRRLSQQEALDHPNVWLFVRHPLDRLVSNWRFWTRNTGGGLIKAIKQASRRDHDIIMCPDSTLEQWTKAALRHDDPHWVSQTEIHTRDGEFVPNTILPVESLTLLRADRRNASTRDADWEKYFTPEFKDQMLVHYADDVALYYTAKEEWDGRAPTVFRGY